MASIKSIDEIIANLIDFFKVASPDLDTKAGSVARDLFVDAPASQLSVLYEELGKISDLQSFRLVAGSDLDRLALNFGASRKQSKKSSGIALLTFNSLPAVVAINSGSLITASNGATFTVLNGITINPSNSNLYKSLATKYQNDLSFLNITDQFAVEVSVQASTAGLTGNISKYSLNRTSIPGVSNVTNVFPFTGGSDQEDDANFRNRVLAIFSGSNIGTSLGYRNLALSDGSALDAIVVGPGDPLMTRDGSIVSDGVVVSEGTGGKVDIVVLGTRTSEFKDTFIYRDKSNNNDPTDAKNDIVLGQITGDENKSITKKRLDNLSAGILPAQPVDDIVEVTGSLSGSNFVPKSIDLFGRITGNYELIKDTGSYGGSPWGFDKFHWLSDRISLFEEDRVKSKFNGQDNTTFTDVLAIPQIKQNISIANENSIVSSTDRSIIQLLHTPATSITRVFNVNTGERYIITDQNFDGSDAINTTGRVQISGNTLPSTNDILQVDYTWVVDYDAFSDYDGKILNNNPRAITDSVDWGIANAVRNEIVEFEENASSTVFSGNVQHPISSVISASEYSTMAGTVIASTVPNFSDRLAISLTGISSEIETIESILTNANAEIYTTKENDGFILNTRVVVGINVKYNVIIVLPTDTFATIGDIVDIFFNKQEVFNISDSTGSFSDKNITIPSANISASGKTLLGITYIAAIQDLISVGINNFPISRLGNGFVYDNIDSGTNSNIIRKENATIQLNLSSQKYITLDLSSNDYDLDGYSIVSVIGLTSKTEIWNPDFPGTVSIDVDNNYELIFSGFNSPVVGDNVLALYVPKDIVRTQPFTFKNDIIKTNFQTLLFDFTREQFYVPLHAFVAETGLEFELIDNATNVVIGSGSDGYTSNISGSFATFSSSTFSFSAISDILGKSIRIINATNRNNTGIFAISAISSNNLTIGIYPNTLNNYQISIIRINDGKELWSVSSEIDAANNILYFENDFVAQGDDVFVSIVSNKNILQAPTRLAINVSDQVINSGILTVSGTTITKVADIVFTAINNGLQQNALEAFKTFLGVSSTTSITNNIVRLVKLEKVETSTNNEVISVLAEYDVFGSSLYDNIFYANEMNTDLSLQGTEFILPSSSANLANEPQIGDKLRITFYYKTNSDFENIYFTRNGTLYTNKVFCLINKIYISSGFNATQSARFTISSFTQPATGSRYKAFYDYLAPKQNERILIRYNYNKLISDTTFTVETSRPLNSDVIVRASRKLLVDATLNVVIKSSFVNSAAIVLQNVKDKITSTINTNILGDVINSSDLIASAQGVDGVDRVRIIYFNENGNVGQVLTLVADKDQSFVANDIEINQESR